MRPAMKSALLALTLCQAAACTPSPTETKAAPAAPADGPAQRRSQINGKINIYIACLNNLDPVILKSRDTYLGWADAEKGPPVKGVTPRFDDVIRKSTYGYDCFEKDGGLGGVQTMAPKLDALDPAGAAYAAAVEQVFAAVNPAAAYYEHGTFKDDGFAKGKELHPKLVAAFSAFDAARGGLHQAIEGLQDQMYGEEQAELEKTDGKKARWHHRTAMHEAERALRIVTAGETPDPAAVKTATDTLKQAADAAKTWTTANQAEADKNVSWATFLSSDLDQVVIQLEELNRGLAAGKGPASDGAGSVGALIDAYNNLVTNSNRLWQ